MLILREFYEEKINVEKKVYFREEFLISNFFILGFECNHSHTYFSHTKTVDYPYPPATFGGSAGASRVGRVDGGWKVGGG